MAEQSFRDAYQLQDISLSPDQLLLDPQNPRIVLRSKRTTEFSHQELATSVVQDHILSIVDSSEFHVADLITGIGRDGFLEHGNRMIVEQVPGTQKFLVLEGNRRTAAIKHLLKRHDSLESHVLSSLRLLPCQQLVLNNSNGYTRDEVVFKLLGMIHLTGALEWGAMERAFYIYQTYMAELRKGFQAFLPDWGNEGEFVYEVPCARRCAEVFNVSVKKVRSEVAIYRSYEGLRQLGYPAQQDHYSLINLAVGNRALNRDYFGIEETTLQFSPEGMERFHHACIDHDCVIKNPKDFKAFARIYRDGTDYEFEIAESGEETLDGVLYRLDRRLDRSEFRVRLEEVEGLMASLPVAAANGTKVERELILKIQELCKKALRALP